MGTKNEDNTNKTVSLTGLELLKISPFICPFYAVYVLEILYKGHYYDGVD